MAANKIDAVDDDARVAALGKRAKTLRLPFFPISAVTGEGVPDLTEAMWRHLAASRSTHPLMRTTAIARRPALPRVPAA